MDRLFLSVLNMSVTGAIVIMAICLIRLPLKASKTPKVISYCLWAVAGFRLIVPFSFESVLGLIPSRTQTIPLIGEGAMTMRDIAAGAPPVFPAATLPALPAVTQDILAPATAIPAALNWAMLAALIWLVGAAAMLVYGVASYVLLKRKMRGTVCSGANIYEADKIKSPFVLGIICPKIYLPAGLSAEAYAYILLHEQTHIRRRDHIVKFVAYFILALHWFNPLAWVAFWLMGADMEMSCDEYVLKELGRKTDYSRLLVSFASKRGFIGTNPLAFGESGIKERVKNVLRFKKRSRVAVVAAVVLTVAASLGLMTNRVYRAEEAEDIPLESITTQDTNHEITDVVSMPVLSPPASSPSVLSPPASSLGPSGSAPGFCTGLLEDEIYRLLRDMTRGEGGRLLQVNRGGLSQITNAAHPNVLSVTYLAGSAWGDAEEISMLENTQLLFDRYSELREVTFRVYDFEGGVNEDIVIITLFTATRDAGNGAGQWCLVDRQTQSAIWWRNINDFDPLLRPIFLWMPEGHDAGSVRAVAGALPLPGYGWQLERLTVGDTFIEYGPHVYSIAIHYTVPDEGGFWWLTAAVEEILMENASRLFAHFNDLKIVSFDMARYASCGTILDFHWLQVNREYIG